MNPYVFFLSLTLCFFLIQCEEIGSKMIKVFAKKYETENKVFTSKPIFINADASRNKINISLSEVTTANEPTDIQFPPHDSRYMFVLEKKGNLFVFDRTEKVKRNLLQLKVVSESELGLLGLAFHPDYPKNPLVYLNYTKDIEGKDTTIISEWKVSDTNDLAKMKVGQERVLLQVTQPYPNHNAGQLAFGADKLLYIGFGDGGSANDPLGMGQNKKAFLGKMLRVDVDAKPADGKTYQIPSSNPFAKSSEYAPEIFALGLRNPWRYTFSPTGDLVVADVGQNKWEEITLVTSGSNQGWNRMEGTHCFSPEKNCAAT